MMKVLEGMNDYESLLHLSLLLKLGIIEVSKSKLYSKLFKPLL